MLESVLTRPAMAKQMEKLMADGAVRGVNFPEFQSALMAMSLKAIKKDYVTNELISSMVTRNVFSTNWFFSKSEPAREAK